MAELYPNDAELNALSGTQDGRQEVPFPAIGESPYYITFYKMLYRLLDATSRAGDLRVYKDGDLTFGLRGGSFSDGDVTVAAAPVSGQALTDNATNYIYLTADGSLTVNTTAFPAASATPHVPLATVVTINGTFDFSHITDCRGKAMFRCLRTGSSTVADGAITTAKIADGAVTTGKLATGVTTPADGSITTAKIADGAVTQTKLANTVAFPPADGSIGTAKLADSAVTRSKLASTVVDGLSLTLDADGLRVADRIQDGIITAQFFGLSALQRYAENLPQGPTDPLGDQSGMDLANCTGQTWDDVNKQYVNVSLQNVGTLPTWSGLSLAQSSTGTLPSATCNLDENGALVTGSELSWNGMGSGMDVAPILTFSDSGLASGGSLPVATCTIDGSGAITSVNWTSRGEGTSSALTASFDYGYYPRLGSIVGWTAGTTVGPTLTFSGTHTRLPAAHVAQDGSAVIDDAGDGLTSDLSMTAHYTPVESLSAMTLQTIAWPLPAQPTKARVVVDCVADPTAVVNTDFAAYVSCDGTTWTKATLASSYTESGGEVFYSSSLVVPGGSGSAILLKIVTTSKSFALYRYEVAVDVIPATH